MFPKIINLTLRLVIEEIEDILNQCPGHPYQVAFSNQELQHKLITTILNQLPNYYAIVEDNQTLPENPRFLYSSLDEQVFLVSLICQSIVDVFQENMASINYHTPQETA